MLALIGLHLVAALAAPLLAPRLGRRTLLAMAVPPLATVVWAITQASRIIDGDPVTERLGWAPGLGFDLTVRVDTFSLVMVALVSGIGVLVFAYASEYFGERADMARLAGLLVAFSGAMLGLVTADNIFALFLCWEATSVTSYLLIGLDDRSATARAAAQRALLVTGAGGLALMGGLVILGQQAGTSSMAEILATPPSGTLVEVALVLVLLGAFTKSAQFPFHFWLPGAMAAPTPVSAYLHSATMVKAGVYLIARMAPSFADVGLWRPLVLTAGLTTMILGGWRALAQYDIKLLLAHGTTSQLGFLVVLVGAGYPEATEAGVILLLAHGAFKAALFMVVGVVDHQAHTRDLRRLQGLHRALRPALVIAAVAAASMAGLPPLLGFIAKEAAYEAFLHAPLGGFTAVVVGGLIVGSVLTFAYSARLVWGAFATKPTRDLVGDPAGPDVARSPVAILVPAALLAGLTLVLGLVPALVSPLAVGGAQVLDIDVGEHTLALWHGVNQALVASMVTIAAGATLFVLRRQVHQLQLRTNVLPAGARLFDVGLQRVLRGAEFVTGVVQPGSLPVYLMIILTTALVVPGAFLLAGMEGLGDLVVADRPMQLVVAVVMVIATVGAVATRHRMGAVLCVGATGYGSAVLFVLQGAPDLALTQLLVETLVLVLFVLVMRHLPMTFSRERRAVRLAPRVVLAVLVGVFASVITLVAFASRPPGPPLGEAFVAAAEDAGGRNVVNVILVDFRAFDTLGEITVLVVASLGVLGLVRAARRDRQRARSGAAARPYRPSLILDAAVRSLFHTVILFSVVLLAVGHNRPGGGFVGGLVAGGAFMLVYLAGGSGRLRRTEPITPELFLGLGITLAALAGVVGWLNGGEFLEPASFGADLPLLGALKLTTSLLFDVGVYLVVIGLVISLLRSLGREEVTL